MTKKADAAAKRAAKIASEDSVIANAGHRRAQFELANPERFQGVETQKGFTSHKETYRSLDIGVAHEPGQTSAGQMNFPGMDHPATVNAPARWEDLHPKVQARIQRNAAKFGVTHDSAVKALGAQVDQSAMWEQNNTPGGRHRSFYAAEGTNTEGVTEPRTRMVESAAKNNVPFAQQAVANAMTSPKTKFSTMPKTGANAGTRIYPNDENASSAVRAAQAGTPDAARSVPGMGGFHGPIRGASHTVSSMMEGKSAAESWNAGPKTGPYHNSWVDPHGPGQFWVSDIHSGGGGIAPHLSVSEREDYLKVGGIHSFNDHVARTVQAQRGIQSMTGMQSMQWNGERRNRDLHDIQPAKPAAPMQGQMDMFSGEHHDVTPATHSNLSQEQFEPTAKDHAAAIAIGAAKTKAAYKRGELKMPVADDDSWTHGNKGSF